MSASPSAVQVPPDGTGKKIDNNQLTTGAGVVQRQVVTIGDSSDPAGLASVLEAPPTGSESALVVRPINPVSVPSYHAGTGGGTVSLGSGVTLECVSVSAVNVDGSFTVNGGDSITVRAGQSLSWNPVGAYVNPTVVMSASLDYIIEGSR